METQTQRPTKTVFKGGMAVSKFKYKNSYEQVETLLRNYHFKEIQNAKVHPNSRTTFIAVPLFVQSNEVNEEVKDDVLQTCGVKIAYKIAGFDKRPNLEKGTYIVYYNLI